MCKLSAPLFSILVASSPRLAKSPDKIEGAMWIAGIVFDLINCHNPNINCKALVT